MHVLIEEAMCLNAREAEGSSLSVTKAGRTVIVGDMRRLRRPSPKPSSSSPASVGSTSAGCAA